LFLDIILQSSSEEQFNIHLSLQDGNLKQRITAWITS
jgi:hypothetical protein